jgi:hypothetical protein
VSLLVHDGELADVCALLAELGLAYQERRGSPTREDEAHSWDLVISTPKRLLEFDSHTSRDQLMRIAILDKDSKTLRSMLQRAGVDLIVRRPVHPAAMRLLVLHSLYRGPEKRRSLRVSIGARVRIRAGLRRRAAVLADLSVTGCRLLASRMVERGSRLSLQIPAELDGGKGFSVSGTVVRTAPSEFPNLEAIAVSFGRPSKRLATRLRDTVAMHSRGPAVLPEGDDHVRLSSAADLGPGPRAQTAAPPRVHSPPIPAHPPAPARNGERRANQRGAYSQHVIALGVEAARVLLGRDISLGGMRVDPHPDVSLGDELRIALHVRAREKPLVVNARIARDEGDEGLVLQFFSLSESTESYLRRMVNFLPILALREDGEEAGGIIVTEILDHQLAEASPA